MYTPSAFAIYKHTGDNACPFIICKGKRSGATRTQEIIHFISNVNWFLFYYMFGIGLWVYGNLSHFMAHICLFRSKKSAYANDQDPTYPYAVERFLGGNINEYQQKFTKTNYQ